MNKQLIAGLFGEAADRLSEAVREPNIQRYKPHRKQVLFHSATTPNRLYIGGNRSGKSMGAVAEDIYYATNTHPYKKTPPPPVRGRVVGVDFLNGVNQILIPIFKRLIVPSMLRGGSWEKAYSRSERVLNFANRSTIEFMSYDQDLDKFAGTSRHFVHYDEEPPLSIYNECQLRLLDTDGDSWMSMTPVNGMTWVYDKLYKPSREDMGRNIILPGDQTRGEVFSSEVNHMTVIEVDVTENPHISAQAIERFMSGLDDEERQARKSGRFVEMGGLVFKSFKDDAHVISQDQFVKPTDGWQVYTSVDHGWNNPTAWLWHAVSSTTGDVITFAEHYASEMTIEQHAKKVLEFEKSMGIVNPIRTGDPAMKQTSGITGTSIIQEYAKHEVYIGVENVPRDVQIGIARMQQYFYVPEGAQPKWRITANCHNLVRELKGLRWKTYTSKKLQYENNKREEIHKKDDHAADSARYFSTFLPDFDPVEQASRSIRDPYGRYDTNLDKPQGSEDGSWTIYTSVD